MAEQPALVLIAPYGPDLWRAVRTAMTSERQTLCRELGRQNSIPDLAAQVLASCPPRFCLAGFCLGAAVAIEIAGLARERVLGLAVINASLAPDSQTQRVIRRQRIAKLDEKVRHGLQYPDVDYVEQTARWLVAPGAARAELRARAMLARVPIAQSLAHQAALLTRPDPRPTLAAELAPVVAISGDHDRICAPIEAADLPQGPIHSAHLLRGCGHLSPLERPETVAMLMNAWLKRIDSSQANKGQDRELTN